VSVTHVIFDIGGVLIDFDFPRLARALADRTGQAPRSLLPLFASDVVHDVETGRTGPETFFRETMSPVLPGLTYGDWIDAWMENYSVNEPGWALLEEARDQGNTVSLLSNLSPYNQVAIDRKWPRFFRAPHHSFYSYDLGLHKPDPDIYRAVSTRLGVDPSHCFFLDDLEENVTSARETGMQALRFHNDRIPEIRQALGLAASESRHS
jgi:HAD superfamily hydrolase (TIGR01509 family)